MPWTTAVAAAAALAMAGGAAALVRRSIRVPLWLVLGTGVLAVGVSSAAAALTGALPVPVAAAIATGALPISVPLSAASRVGRAASAMTLTASAWGAVVVPAAIVAPAALVRLCPPSVCVVEDFGGALPFVVGAGAFLLVPAVATVGRNRLHSGTGSRLTDLLAALAFWAGFIVWLTALEGAVDEYTAGIALAAALAPAGGALGWLLVDRVRGVDATAGRALRMGLLAGMGGLLPCVVAVSLPWAITVGVLAGAVGALVHDARGMSSSPPGTRAAVAAIAVGVLGMLAPGIVGQTLGFVFAARADVLGMQLLASLGVAIVAIAVSVPVAAVVRRSRVSGRPRTPAR